MLGPQHEVAGGVIGILFAGWLLLLNHPLLALFTLGISIWAATLPDIIDPPTSPHHRSVGHSFVSVIGFGLGFLLFFSLSLLTSWWIFIMSSAFTLSFLVHLILDLTTPAGLPVFVGKTLFGVLEIPLYLIPGLNIILILITILTSMYGVYYMSKKIGGKATFIILLFPVWGIFGIATIAFFQIDISILGVIFLILSIISITFALVAGHLIDIKLKKKAVPTQQAPKTKKS